MDPNVLIGIVVLLIFLAGAATMVTRKLPAILTLPLMGVAIVCFTALIQRVLMVAPEKQISAMDILGGVLTEGSLMLHVAMIVAFFGGVISFVMQKSGTAEALVKQGAELIGDNPLAVAVFSMGLIALLFTSIGGLGAIIMVAMVVLPMLATVGIHPVVAGGIMLMGISLGGILNAGNWVIYTQAPLSVPIESVKSFAIIVFLLTAVAGVTFISVELYRNGTIRSLFRVIGTIVASAGAGGLAVFLFSLIGSAQKPVAFTIPVTDPAKSAHLTHWAPDRVQSLSTTNQLVFRVEPAVGGAPTPFIGIDDLPTNDPEGSAIFPEDWSAYRELEFAYSSTQPGILAISFVGKSGTKVVDFRVQDDSVDKPHTGRLRLAPVVGATGTSVQAISASFRPESTKGIDLAGPFTVSIGGLKLNPPPMTPGWLKIVRGGVGVMLLLLVLAIAVDVKARVRRWRHQEVRVRWFAYLIPVIPLVLILVFEVPPLTAFVIGVLYAIVSTLRPGSISLTIQSLIQGSSTVMPAVMLMVGIGILIRSVLGPSGWSEAHGGSSWPVLESIGPIFRSVVPETRLGYVLFFGALAPLALYRGPLNVWGLGYGIAALLMASGNIAGSAVMAMLLTVGQVQGICDPTNTHNVWLANELRVDVQALMWRTIPYVWAMVFIGLAVAAFTPGIWGTP